MDDDISMRAMLRINNLLNLNKFNDLINKVQNFPNIEAANEEQEDVEEEEIIVTNNFQLESLNNKIYKKPLR